MMILKRQDKIKRVKAKKSKDALGFFWQKSIAFFRVFYGGFSLQKTKVWKYTTRLNSFSIPLRYYEFEFPCLIIDLPTQISNASF